MRLDDDFKRRVIEMLTVLTSDVGQLKAGVSVLKTDVAGLKTAVARLETDVAGLKTDGQSLKQLLIGVDIRVSRLERETLTQFTVLTREVHELRSRFDAHEAYSSHQLLSIDGHYVEISAALDDFRSLHTSSTRLILARLDDHERRISALEQRGGS